MTSSKSALECELRFSVGIAWSARQHNPVLSATFKFCNDFDLKFALDIYNSNCRSYLNINEFLSHSVTTLFHAKKLTVWLVIS